MAAEGGLPIHPMDQFIVKPLFGEGPVHWYTPTNATLWLLLAVVVIGLIMVIGTSRRAVVPGRSQSIAEILYGFVHDMIEDVTGHEGVKYFPYVLTLFLFVLFANLLGLVPMSFSPTSQIATTVVLALLVFFGVTLIGLSRKGVGFLSMFWVSSAPLALRPVLAIIEIISYFIRPVSHSVRLAGAMLAGHAVLKVFAGFAAALVVAPLAFAGMVGIYALELLVAAVQAYVFTILTCVYLKDAVSDAHH